jgi:DNA repair protein RAD16
MSLEQRDRAVAAFSANPDIRVFLLSLKAGGVALNLTAASHVFLMVRLKGMPSTLCIYQ